MLHRYVINILENVLLGKLVTVWRGDPANFPV